MKKLYILVTILFSMMMFSSHSYSEWKELEQSWIGKYYIDFDRIRKVDGYVYFWRLYDLLKPDTDGHMSYRGYVQGDCKLFRLKILSFSNHNFPMGRGDLKKNTTVKNPTWTYPSPKSVAENSLKAVCNYIK